jgi:peroxiredoxin Q/BCP
LRDDIEKFTEAGATVVAVAPDTLEGVARFTRDDAYPFPLLADAEHAVFDAYDVIATLMSLGQRPAVFIVDAAGLVRFDSIGSQQWQIPTNENVLAVLSEL